MQRHTEHVAKSQLIRACKDLRTCETWVLDFEQMKGLTASTVVILYLEESQVFSIIVCQARGLSVLQRENGSAGIGPRDWVRVLQ